MKPIASALAIAIVAATPALAQDTRSPSDDFRDGAEKMGEAFSHFLDGLAKELDPMAEAWREMLEELGDLNRYEAPETLPNGDIIIRRKPDVENDGSTGETEL